MLISVLLILYTQRSEKVNPDHLSTSVLGVAQV
jgi:hypothetical protein